MNRRRRRPTKFPVWILWAAIPVLVSAVAVIAARPWNGGDPSPVAAGVGSGSGSAMSSAPSPSGGATSSAQSSASASASPSVSTSISTDKRADSFAYSYVDDDATSTFTCGGECDYRITFGLST